MEGVIELRRLLEASGLQSESASRIRALGGGSQQSGTWARLWRVEIRQAAHGPTAKESRDLGLIPLLGKLGGVAKSVELVSRQPLAHQPKMSQNVTRPDSQDSQSPLFCDTRGANPLHFPIEFQLHRVQSMFNAAFVYICTYLGTLHGQHILYVLGYYFYLRKLPSWSHSDCCVGPGHCPCPRSRHLPSVGLT